MSEEIATRRANAVIMLMRARDRLERHGATDRARIMASTELNTALLDALCEVLVAAGVIEAAVLEAKIVAHIEARTATLEQRDAELANQAATPRGGGWRPR